MRRIYSLFALCALFLFIITPHAYATDYTVEPGSIAASYALPIFMGTTSSAGSFYGSITQHIYLASELLDANENLATEGDITDITFYYTAKSSTTASSVSRTIGIYLMEVESSVTEYTMTALPYQDVYDNTQYSYQSYFLYNASNKAGTNVYSGALTTEEVTNPTVKTVKLHLTTPFHWSGNKNIVMTVWDKTASTNSSSNLRFQISSTKTGTAPSEVGHPRFAYTYWASSSADQASWITENGNYNFSSKLGDYYGANSTENKGEDAQKKQRSYVPKTTFSISTTIPAPTNLGASSITSSSAHLSWDAAAGATSYNVKWGTNSGSLDHSADGVTNTYLDIDELVDGTRYYFSVQTVTAGGTSAFSDAAYFDTEEITISHDGIDFVKWNSTTAMPLSGDYYLSADVTLSSTATISDDLNLDLNGNKILTSSYGIVIPEGESLSLYDNVGGGVIRGAYAGTFTNQGLITNSGTLVIREGAVVNLSEGAGDYNVAISNKGTFKLSEEPTISGVKADISLGTNAKITIESGKPLTNDTKYSIDAVGTTITTGWSNMSGAKPSAYFSSAKSTHRGVALKDNEAELVKVLAMNDNTENAGISDGNYAGLINSTLSGRTITNAQYNTICLPFALNNAQMEEVFGSGYDLEELISSSLEDDLLSLVFERKYALEAGKPYLLQPSVAVANPSFEGVTITATSPVDIETKNVDFKGNYAPTALTGGNKSQLFLDAGNVLKYPVADANLKGFRAYFQVKGEAVALASVRTRIVLHEDAATGLEQTSQEPIANSQKLIKDGQLIIERNGMLYNAQGQVIK